MFSKNPFAELSGTISPDIMKWYVVIMALCVAGGTLFDIIHKGSARYFFENWRNSKAQAKKDVSGGEAIGVAMNTVAHDVLTSGEFCNQKRRIAHLLTMYGFILHLVMTAIMVFGYTGGAATPAYMAQLWYLGAALVSVGGYWFWFFIRVDVAAEGNPWNRIVRADLFILSLLASCTLAILWGLAQAAGSPGSMILLGLYLIATTILFGGVPWSKFSHMFFKPAAAFERRMSVANETRNNLPKPADRTSAEDRDRHSMELLKDAPLDMGLGIKREQPRHY